MNLYLPTDIHGVIIKYSFHDFKRIDWIELFYYPGLFDGHVILKLFNCLDWTQLENFEMRLNDWQKKMKFVNMRKRIEETDCGLLTKRY